MATFQFVHGDPLMIDHTPSSAVSAGDVVFKAGRACIAHTDIPADTLGAVAFPCGRTVYEITEDIPFDSTDDDDIAAGGFLCGDDTTFAKFLNTAGGVTTYVGTMIDAVVAGATTGKKIIHGG